MFYYFAQHRKLVISFFDLCYFIEYLIIKIKIMSEFVENA